MKQFDSEWKMGLTLLSYSEFDSGGEYNTVQYNFLVEYKKFPSGLSLISNVQQTLREAFIRYFSKA